MHCQLLSACPAERRLELALPCYTLDPVNSSLTYSLTAVRLRKFYKKLRNTRKDSGSDILHTCSSAARVLLPICNTIWPELPGSQRALSERHKVGGLYPSNPICSPSKRLPTHRCHMQIRFFMDKQTRGIPWFSKMFLTRSVFLVGICPHLQ